MLRCIASERNSLILIFTCISLSSFSQRNFIPGYVVQNGDTLKGLIDYRNWQGNADVLSFKIDVDDEPLQFQPVDVSAFGVHDEIYVSAAVQTDISPGVSSLLVEENNSEVRLNTDTVFLQTLVKGTKSLYFFKNRVHKPQFYIEGDSTWFGIHIRREMRPFSSVPDYLTARQ